MLFICRREGAGRKPKALINGFHPLSAKIIETRGQAGNTSSTLHPPSSEISEVHQATGSHQDVSDLPSRSDSLSDGHQTPSLIRSWCPDIPPVLETTLNSQIYAPLSPTDSSHCSQVSKLAWDTISSEKSYMGYIGSTFDPQSPEQLSSPFNSHPQTYYLSPASSQNNENGSTPETSTSQYLNPLDIAQSPIGDVEGSLEYSGSVSPPCNPKPQLDSYSNAFCKPDTVLSSCEPTACPLPSQLSSVPPAVVPLGSFVHIAPAPPPPAHQQCTWVFPYPLLRNKTAPVHRLAIISQSPTQKRRPRRCIVCLQLGREEASYGCPGRGDRTRCPSRRGDCTERIHVFKKQRCDQRATEQTKALLSSTSEIVSAPPVPAIGHKDAGAYGSYLSQPAVRSVTPMPILIYSDIVAPPYVSLLPWGHSFHASKEFVITSGERRSRRCMICVTRDKDGTLCPGRGNRTLCPNREETMDLINTKRGGKAA